MVHPEGLRVCERVEGLHTLSEKLPLVPQRGQLAVLTGEEQRLTGWEAKGMSPHGRHQENHIHKHSI